MILVIDQIGCQINIPIVHYEKFNKIGSINSFLNALNTSLLNTVKRQNMHAHVHELIHMSNKKEEILT